MQEPARDPSLTSRKAEDTLNNGQPRWTQELPQKVLHVSSRPPVTKVNHKGPKSEPLPTKINNELPESDHTFHSRTQASNYREENPILASLKKKAPLHSRGNMATPDRPTETRTLTSTSHVRTLAPNLLVKKYIDQIQSGSDHKLPPNELKEKPEKTEGGAPSEPRGRGKRSESSERLIQPVKNSIASDLKKRESSSRGSEGGEGKNKPPAEVKSSGREERVRRTKKEGPRPMSHSSNTNGNNNSHQQPDSMKLKSHDTSHDTVSSERNLPTASNPTTSNTATLTYSPFKRDTGKDHSLTRPSSHLPSHSSTVRELRHYNRPTSTSPSPPSPAKAVQTDTLMSSILSSSAPTHHHSPPTDTSRSLLSSSAPSHQLSPLKWDLAGLPWRQPSPVSKRRMLPHGNTLYQRTTTDEHGIMRSMC